MTDTGRKVVKVNLYITLEIDADTYREEFGEPDASVADVREYVKSAAESAARSELERFVVR